MFGIGLAINNFDVAALTNILLFSSSEYLIPAIILTTISNELLKLFKYLVNTGYKDESLYIPASYIKLSINLFFISSLISRFLQLDFL